MSEIDRRRESLSRDRVAHDGTHLITDQRVPVGHTDGSLTQHRPFDRRLAGVPA